MKHPRFVASAAFVVLTALSSLTACGSSPPDAAHPSGPNGDHVDGAKAKKLVQGGAKLIDVRGADEYGAKHIDGAENDPVETIDDADLGPKDTPLVLYCSSGARSSRAATQLRAKGYLHVYELGAMSNWDK